MAANEAAPAAAAAEVKQEVPPETSEADLQEAISRASAKKEEWAKLDAAAKLAHLRTMIATLDAELPKWEKVGAAGHGYDINNPAHAHLIGEVDIMGAGVIGSWINGMIRLYESLAKTGNPLPLGKVTKRGDGTSAVRVYPSGFVQNLFADGMTVDVIVGADKQVTQYNPLKRPAGVIGVLAAGNFDAPIDALSALFLENKVVVFKANPVNYHTVKNIQSVFSSLEKLDYIKFVYGGPAQGTALVNSDKVDELCMTGSCRTYDKIVWGNNAKKEGEPGLHKPFKAELGSVNPYIVCPGVWSDSEIDAHAQALASYRMLNDGHICASPQVVITSRHWAQREKYLAKVREYLAKHPATRPYYPACEASYKRQLDALEAAGYKVEDVVVKNPDSFPGQLHPIFATDVKPGSYITQEEAFCPVLSEVALDVPADPSAFLPEAVKFANEGTWGSLTGTLLVDGTTMKLASEAVESALDQMKFGAVGLNQVGGFAIIHPEALWGAYPGHTVQDIQSGIGKLGGVHCIENVDKVVVRFPFFYRGAMKVPINPKDGWLVNRRLSEFLINQSMWRLVKVLGAVVAKM